MPSKNGVQNGSEAMESRRPPGCIHYYTTMWNILGLAKNYVAGACLAKMRYKMVVKPWKADTSARMHPLLYY